MAQKKKASRPRAAAGAQGSAFAEQVGASAQQIWLAGLGAFSRARTEGDKLFEMLVQRGMSLRGDAREAAEDALKSVRTQVDAAASQAQGKWDKLEQVFEQRVARALNRLGVVAGMDLEDLSRQVAELNESVRALSKGSAAGPKAKARRKKAAK